MPKKPSAKAINKAANPTQVERKQVDPDYKDYIDFKEKTKYEGTIEEYRNLSKDERDKILINYLHNSYINLKNTIFNKIEENYKKIVSGDVYQKNYEDILKYLEHLNNSLQGINEIIRKNNLSIEIPKELLSLVDTNIERPKFNFIDKRKYKLLDSLLTEEYIYKLKTRQIASNFNSDSDYNNKDKWKEFIDIKEREYQQLLSREPITYKGSFQEYLQENTLVTSEYLHYGYSITKQNEQQSLENQRRIEEANKVYEMNQRAADESNYIVNNSPAARRISEYSLNAIKSVMNNSSNNRPNASSELQDMLNEGQSTKREYIFDSKTIEFYNLKMNTYKEMISSSEKDLEDLKILRDYNINHSKFDQIIEQKMQNGEEIDRNTWLRLLSEMVLDNEDNGIYGLDEENKEYYQSSIDKCNTKIRTFKRCKEMYELALAHSIPEEELKQIIENHHNNITDEDEVNKMMEDLRTLISSKENGNNRIYTN